MKERTLAAAARADKGDKFTGADSEIHLLQCMNEGRLPL
jgi:hypothetical protein